MYYCDYCFSGELSFWVYDFMVILQRCVAWVLISYLLYRKGERIATIASITYTATLLYDIPDFLIFTERYSGSIALSLVPVVLGLVLGLWLDFRHSLRGLATEYTSGTMVAFFRPNNFWSFLSTWNAAEVSGCMLIHDNHIYTFYRGEYTKRTLNKRLLNNMIFVPINVPDLDKRLAAKLGSKYSPLSENCSTVLSGLIGKPVIQPNVFLKQLLARK